MVVRGKRLRILLLPYLFVAGLPSNMSASVGVYQKLNTIDANTEQILTDVTMLEHAIESLSSIEGAASSLELLLQEFEQITKNLTNVDALASSIEQIKPQLSSIESAVGSIDSKVDLLATETTSLLIESKIDVLNTTEHTTQSKIFVMNSELVGVDSKIDELAVDVAALQATENSINSKVDILQLDALATLTTINTTQSKIFVMNNELVGVDSKIDELAVDVAALQATENSINSKVDILQLDGLATLTTLNTTQSKIFVMNTELVGVDSKIDVLQQTSNVTESLVERIESLIAEPELQSSGAMQINTPGTYSLTSDFAGQININSSNVNLNLNGYRVYGGTNGIVVNGVTHVVIYNGAIQSATNDGIAINAGSSAVTIKDLTIMDSTNAVVTTSSSTIYFDHVNTISCVNGFSYQNAHNVIVDDCSASEMTARGFYLDGCSVVNHRRCKAMNLSGTGIVAGFYSSNGNTNLFDQCYAEGISTSATSTAMYAAGFVLSDTASTIIRNCTADSIAAPNTTAYGINAGVLSSELIATTSYDTSIVTSFNNVATNTVNDFVAAVGTNTVLNVGIINIYDISTDQFVLTSSASTSTVYPSVQDASWSPDGNYLAAIGNGTGANILSVYTVNGGGIIGLSPVTTTSTISAQAVSWSPTGSFIAVGGQDLSNNGVILLYHFDGASLTLLDSVLVGSTIIGSVSWSFDAQYLAAGGDIFVVYELIAGLLVRRFASTSFQVAKVASSPTVNDVAVLMGLVSPSILFLSLFELIRGAPLDNRGQDPDLAFFAMFQAGVANAPEIDLGSIGKGNWSKNGQSFAVAGLLPNGLSNFCDIYANGGNFSLTIRHDIAANRCNGVVWNRASNRIIVCGAAGTTLTPTGASLWLLSFDQNTLAYQCIIDGAGVSNVHGSAEGIGIAAISTLNSITNNTAENCDTSFGLGVNNIKVGFATQAWPIANLSI